jgi:mevalonate kinase
MRYPGKILWFGEHTVLRGSKALAGPLPAFGGSWRESGTPAQQQRLSEWLGWLRVQQTARSLTAGYDLDRFDRDLAAGLYFDSDIPVGYGAGSSGALCAAFYARYVREPIAPDTSGQLAQLKNIFAQLEGFFHGSSSGTDPLICYANTGLLLEPGGSISRVALPALPAAHSFFLIDTTIRRSTGPLVEAFLERCDQDAGFRQKALRALVTVSDVALDIWLEQRFDDLVPAMHALSELQLRHLNFLIPDAFRELWQNALETKHTRLKLCGAGGGGFLLGYSVDRAATEAFLPKGSTIWL